jgi:hypothetical protein
MIQKFEVWIDVIGVVISDNAVEQVDLARRLFQELGFLSAEKTAGGRKLVGVDRVGQQLRVTLENERGLDRPTTETERLVVKTEEIFAVFYPGVSVDPKRLRAGGYPIDLRRLPIEPHAVDELRYYMTELFAERMKVRAAQGQSSDFRFVNVLARGMHGVERRVGGNLGPIARTSR